MGDDLVLNKKTVLALDPEDRAVWLTTAFRKAGAYEVKTNQIYDIISSPKLAEDLPEKIGLRMLRSLRKHMHIFSEKQQRYLANHALIQYEVAAKEKKKEAERAPVRPSADDDAAARMEEMMARCRNFVRAQASTYNEKEKTALELEKQAKLKQEWDAIDAWHSELEEWERRALTQEDYRLHQHALKAERERKKAIEKWENESRERARQEEEIRKIEDAKRQEELRIQREKFMAEEEVRRQAEERRLRAEMERKAAEDRRKEEIYQADARRREAEKRRRQMEEWRRKEAEKERDAAERRRRAEEEKRMEDERQRREMERWRVEEERRRQRVEEERRIAEERRHADDQRRRAMEGQRAVSDALQRAAASVTTSLKRREVERDVVQSSSSRGSSRGAEPVARSRKADITFNMSSASVPPPTSQAPPPKAMPKSGWASNTVPPRFGGLDDLCDNLQTGAPVRGASSSEASKVSPLLGLLRGSSNVVIDVPTKKRKTEEPESPPSGKAPATGWLLPSSR
mmetsp:Transcript_105797/g.183924  ORF Transcript_105797/g.183924 Transcript_105797/m.183924 type:complete len:515 (-) Transcript_105797:62-1606(-)